MTTQEQHIFLVSNGLGKKKQLKTLFGVVHCCCKSSFSLNPEWKRLQLKVALLRLVSMVTAVDHEGSKFSFFWLIEKLSTVGKTASHRKTNGTNGTSDVWDASSSAGPSSSLWHVWFLNCPTLIICSWDENGTNSWLLMEVQTCPDSPETLFRLGSDWDKTGCWDWV